ncbi:MAG: hypothetical protein NZ700_02960 [Gemmataceae bacterium]|nr:hypothetical protein [Gemmataceae bacterium]MDW8266707.1 hydantoinase/oxoprolinase family protein [Gemmataceae bacterium]
MRPGTIAGTRSVVGLDVGGANVKAAHVGGSAATLPFPLWKDPAGLTSRLRALLDKLPTSDLLAVTMTGELCDCFQSKREGVACILDAVEGAAQGRPVWVWQTTGHFVDPTTARVEVTPTASSNWHALASWAGRLAPRGTALLVDMGSTTTDVIPLTDGQPSSRGRTDWQRLKHRELVYVGARRTPLCALMAGRGAAEVFATTRDVGLLLGLEPEDGADRDTADGRPATRPAAHARLARMLCADVESMSRQQAKALARHLFRRVARRVAGALDQVAQNLSPLPETLIVAGSGERWVMEALRWTAAFRPARTIRLAELLGRDISAAACAFALAVLACEGLDPS